MVVGRLSVQGSSAFVKGGVLGKAPYPAWKLSAGVSRLLVCLLSLMVSTVVTILTLAH